MHLFQEPISDLLLLDVPLTGKFLLCCCIFTTFEGKKKLETKYVICVVSILVLSDWDALSQIPVIYNIAMTEFVVSVILSPDLKTLQSEVNILSIN